MPDLGELAAGAARLPKTAAVGYLRGLSYPFRGMRFVFVEHRELARFWIFPILITVLAFALLGWGVVSHYDSIISEPTGDGFWSDVGRFLLPVLQIVIAVALFLVGAILIALLVGIFAAPFNDALSEEVERLVSGREGPPLTFAGVFRDFLRTIRVELTKLFVYLAVMGPLFVASFLIPGVGQLLYTVFGFLFTTLYLGLDYVDWPISRRGLGARYRFGLLRRQLLALFGFGTGVWALLFVPFVNLLFMPAAVAGGTLLYLDLEPAAAGPSSTRSEMIDA